MGELAGWRTREFHFPNSPIRQFARWSNSLKRVVEVGQQRGGILETD